MDLERELAATLNRVSAESASNTPDWVLAQYLLGCLAAFNMAIQQRETWHGRDARPAATQEAPEGGPPVIRHEHSEPGTNAVVARLVREVADELRRAQAKFPRFSGPHEGYAVILEELDELWDEVRASKPGGDRAAMREEAIQVAAMALRFVHDCVPAAPPAATPGEEEG